MAATRRKFNRSYLISSVSPFWSGVCMLHSEILLPRSINTPLIKSNRERISNTELDSRDKTLKITSTPEIELTRRLNLEGSQGDQVKHTQISTVQRKNNIFWSCSTLKVWFDSNYAWVPPQKISFLLWLKSSKLHIFSSYFRLLICKVIQQNIDRSFDMRPRSGLANFGTSRTYKNHSWEID